MKRTIKLSVSAKQTLDRLAKGNPKKAKKVYKTLGLMEVNVRHPSLKTHKYSSMQGPKGEEVFEAYVENRTPSAFRVFWIYGPGNADITILAITAHP